MAGDLCCMAGELCCIVVFYVVELVIGVPVWISFIIKLMWPVFNVYKLRALS